jgi:hypothetical protein
VDIHHVLRGLEHVCHSSAPPDERLHDAVEVLQHAQHKDGRWPSHRTAAKFRKFRYLEPEINGSSLTTADIWLRLAGSK